LEYVEPVDANLCTYSHRLYELLLRTSTEWESVCKDALVSIGYTVAPRDMNVNDYTQLESILLLETVEIGLDFWRPARVLVQPYQGWTTAQPPLSWYKSYNSVKHNRNSEFPRATLDNVRQAMAALFALHERLHLLPFVMGTRDRATGDPHVFHREYPGLLFSFQGKVLPH
jgi:hypothetical protein